MPRQINRIVKTEDANKPPEIGTNGINYGNVPQNSLAKFFCPGCYQKAREAKDWEVQREGMNQSWITVVPWAVAARGDVVCKECGFKTEKTNWPTKAVLENMPGTHEQKISALQGLSSAESGEPSEISTLIQEHITDPKNPYRKQWQGQLLPSPTPSPTPVTLRDHLGEFSG